MCAHAFGVAPWMLLLPQLDPSDLPDQVLTRSQHAAMMDLRIAAETIARYKT